VELQAIEEIRYQPPSEYLMRSLQEIQALQAEGYQPLPRVRGEVESLRAVVAERDVARAELAQRTAERDRWLEHTKFVMRDRIAIRVELDAARAELATALLIIENDTRLITEQAAEIAVLRAAAAFKAPEPERPVLKPNPFREFRSDRRRIGGNP